VLVPIKGLNVYIDIQEFRISPKEREDLARLLAEDASLAGFPQPEEGQYGKITIRLSRDQIRYLRDYMGTRLAKVGFDENYEPNEESRILEDLIDRFFVS
jgi:hypothetical protein